MLRDPVTRLSVAILTTACLLAGCSGGGDDEGPEPAAESSAGEPGAGAAPDASPVDFAAPGRKQLARGVRLGDQTDQGLRGVARNRTAVVAVGFDDSYNTTRPLFLVSPDGETWSRGEVSEETAADAEGPEAALSVAAGPDGFVAVGSGADDRPVLWTSEDGATWTRVPVGDDAFRPADHAQDVRFEGGRFYLLGSNETPYRSATSRAVLWTSEDGADWKRTDLARAGLGSVIGTPYLADVAVLGRQVVLAGGIENSASTDQPNRMLVWRSSDGARTFHADPTPIDFGGDFRAYARDLVVHDGTLHLAASGDGVGSDGSSWDAVVMVARGREWVKQSSPAFSTGEEEHPAALVRAGRDWVLAGYTAGGKEDAVVTSGPTAGALGPVASPSLRGTNEQYVSEGVSLGDSALLVGVTERSGSTEPALWRVTGGRVEPVELPEGVAGGRPTAEVETVLAVDGGYVALGAVADSPVVWRSEDFEEWTAQGLSGRSATVGSVAITAATVLPGGEALAIGWQNRALGNDIAGWSQRDGGWGGLESTAFLNRGAGGYGSVLATDVAAGHGRVVAAGYAYINGENEAYPLVSRSRGLHWEKGRGARAVPLTDQDRYFGRTPYLDFRSPINGTVTMNAVVATDRGFLIGGHRGDGGRGVQATTWASRDGLTWAASEQLPPTQGAYATSVDQLVTSGSLVVAAGSAESSADDVDPGWTSWASSDNGRTWEAADLVVDDQARVLSLVALDGGVLALGSTGPLSTADAAAWFSTDGLTWTAYDLGLERGSGPGRQWVQHAVVEGDTLRLVAADVPPEGGGYYAESVAAPSP